LAAAAHTRDGAYADKLSGREGCPAAQRVADAVAGQGTVDDIGVQYVQYMWAVAPQQLSSELV
jgi:hypothetical protein